MRILAAQLTDFRNISASELRFSPDLTALIGPNGQGKTNLLEALYVVAALRPLRNVPRAELIRGGQKKARVSLKVRSERTGLTHDLAVDLLKTVRHLEKDDKRCDTRTFIGHLVCVAFTPDDLNLTKGSPDVRRRFVDRAILNTRPGYLDTALRYQQAVKSRNKVLQDEGADALLEPYEAVIALEGAKVATTRAAYVKRLAPQIISNFDRIARPAPVLSVSYSSTLQDALQIEDVEATAEAFSAILERRRKHDRHRKSTTVGPHRDDVELNLDGVPAKVRASQGQHRAMVLALKLAEITHLTEVLGEAPVLLLDDISSELDAERSDQLFETMAELRGQVILTTTDDKQVPGRGETTAIYDVSAGEIRPRTGAA